MIYGIDFDGTIVEEIFPEIGEPIVRVVDFIRELQERGDKWILITMREGKYLDEAVEWLKAHGITPDAVNDNLPELVEMWGNNPRKIYADIFIDDHNANGVVLPGSNDWMPGDVMPVERGRYIEEIEIEYENDLGTFHAIGLFHIADSVPVFLEVLTGTKIDWSKTVKRWRYYAD
jgi:hypothetical protein